jgi:hypothetical protein
MLKQYEKLMTNPAWASMRGMHVSPADPFLPDGTIMRGNVITRNIFYYPGRPESRYIGENGVNLQYSLTRFNWRTPRPGSNCWPPRPNAGSR